MLLDNLKDHRFPGDILPVCNNTEYLLLHLLTSNPVIFKLFEKPKPLYIWAIMINNINKYYYYLEYYEVFGFLIKKTKDEKRFYKDVPYSFIASSSFFVSFFWFVNSQTIFFSILF